jgi:hypothetical protein
MLATKVKQGRVAIVYFCSSVNRCYSSCSSWSCWMGYHRNSDLTRHVRFFVSGRDFFYEQNDNNLDYNSKVKEDFKENSLIRSTYNK